ncbi:MAG: septal ring lytic transglycosylase RlpA family protein [Sphingomonadales bacterium]|jgi:rare lipoprotein A
MTERIVTLLVLALFTLSACGSPAPRNSRSQNVPLPSASSGKVKVGKPYRIAGVWYYPKDDVAYDQIGIASWYGPGFHGKPTASGERFDQNALTAAHTTLPMPSYIEVTNLDNGRKVVLKVNDRGPFARGRILDVSRRGAQLLGFHSQGTARVRVRRTDRHGNPLMIAREEPTYVAAPSAPINATSPVFVQVGSFLNYDNAHRLQGKLGDLGRISLEAAMVGGQTTYRVRIGPFSRAEDAGRVLADLQGRGFPNARIVSQKNS